MLASSDRSRVSPADHHAGFTLIEITIVLVIIGLITGGILTGRDLINAASTRMQISQIERYQTAVATFQGKYGGLPGDLSASLASQFNFVARDGETGRGDGDGLIEGYCYDGSGDFYGWAQSGEPLFFWSDLSRAGMMEGAFNAVTDAVHVTLSQTSAPSLNNYFPAAKIGQRNYVYVFSLGYINMPGDGYNYFGLMVMNSVPGVCGALADFTTGISVAQAYAIDKKMDDGLPASGNVQTIMVNNYYFPSPNAASDSATTCFNSATNAYSVTVNNGANLNCALSFRMK